MRPPGAALRYRPEIDGLRALAVVAVMLYHLAGLWLPGGFLGVDVFFVISGFVVTGSLTAAGADGPGAYLGGFYARRLARIVPALLAMLVLTGIGTALFVPRSWLSAMSERTGFAAFFGLSNWVLQTQAEGYFAPRADFNPYTHTWSLGVEEQFYLGFPILLYLWLRPGASGRQRVLVAGLIAALGAASLAAFVWDAPRYPAVAFYSVACRFWELAAGALLFQFSADAALLGAARLPGAGAAAPWVGAGLVALALACGAQDRFPVAWAIAAVAGTVLILHATGSGEPGILHRLLAGVLPVWIGRRSYSLYLWHWPVYVLMRWTIGIESAAARGAAVCASVLLAAASYRWIEQPLRHNAALRRCPPALQIEFFLPLIGGAWLVARGAFLERPRISLSVVNRNALDWFPDVGMPYTLQAACAVERTETAVGAGGNRRRFVGRNCVAAAPAHTLTVLGDSHAEAYMPMFAALAAETGRAVTVYTKPGCAFLPLQQSMRADDAGACWEFWALAVREVLATANPGDTLFLPSLRLPRICGQWQCRQADALASGGPQAPPDPWIAAASAEAREVLHPLAERGMDIIFEAPKPIFKSPPFRCADWFDRGNPICEQGTSVARAELEQLRRPVLEAQQELARTVPGLRIWDPFPLLCPQSRCEAYRDGRPLFYDADHLSGFGNALLYPAFKAAIEAPPH